MLDALFVRRPNPVVVRVLLAVLWVHAVGAGVTVRPPIAQAKVNPLEIITAQLKKANGLILLDTSGSMTGVPGDVFTPASEVGVDCDNGRNCRQVNQAGLCKGGVVPPPPGLQICSNHDDCRHGWCEDLKGTTDRTACYKDWDCPLSGGKCSKTLNNCQYDADCVAATGACPLYGTCSAGSPCPMVGRCDIDGTLCLNVGGACAGGKRCSSNPALTCTTNADCPPPAGPTAPSGNLVGHYAFNEGGGTVINDLSPYANHGTLLGTASWVAGKTGSGIDSAAGCVEIPAKPEHNGTTGFTMTAWTKLNAFPGPGGFRYIFNKHKLGTIFEHYALKYDSSKASINGDWGNQTTGTGWNDTGWHHIATSWDPGSTRLKVFFDGVLILNNTWSGPLTTSAGRLYIGCNNQNADPDGQPPDLQEFFPGVIDEAKIYNVALSDSQIATEFATGGASSPAVSGTGLLAWYEFETVGATTPDSSGNGRTATVEGGATTGTGRIGNGLVLNGTSQCAWTPGTGAMDIQSDYTLAAWVYINALGGEQTFVGKSHGVSWNPDYNMAVNPGGNQYHWAQEVIPQAGGLTAGAWHHIAHTVDKAAGSITIYRDGVPMDTVSTGVVWQPSTDNWTIGCHERYPTGGFTEFLNGVIDDVRIYGRKLALSEIQSLASGAGGPAVGLVGKWKMDENTGTSVVDATGNGANLGFFGTPAPVWSNGRNGGYAVQTGYGNGLASFLGPSAAINSITHATGLSIAAWVIPPADGAKDSILYVGKSGGGVQYGFDLSGGVMRFTVGGTTVSSSLSVPGGGWQHLGVTWSGTTAKFYRNGAPWGTAALAGTFPTLNEEVVIGNSAHPIVPADSFAGSFDDVELYGRALSDAEMAALGSAPPGGVANDLIGAWNFDEGTGTTASDSSGNNNHAILAAGGAAPQWFTPAQTNAGLRFTGGQYAVVPASPSLNSITNSLTVSAWVKRTGSSAWWQHIFNRQIGTGPFEHLGFGLLGDRLAFINSGSNPITLQAPTALPLNTWVHVSVTWDGSNLKLWQDEVEVATAGWTGSPQPDTSQLTIGANLNGGGTPEEFFQGELDGIFAYNRALAPAELTTLRNRATNPTSGGLCVDRMCNRVENICPVSDNKCQSATSTICNGVDETRYCELSATTPGPAKMCEVSQSLCVLDSHCPNGEKCVPASSRAVIAKRVIKSLLLENYDLINFGLMTFRQEGYYPYYQINPATLVTQTLTQYFTRPELERAGCFDETGGPKATCTVNAQSYTLHTSNASRYQLQVKGNGGGKLNVTYEDQNWCGLSCSVTTGRGTGLFVGASYDYTVSYAPYDGSSTPIMRPNYEGRVINVAGVPYVYFTPRSDYYYDPQGGTNRPPIRGVKDCAAGNACSKECGAGWDPAVAPFMSLADDPVAAEANVVKFMPRLAYAEEGGIMSWERSPVGCALYNDGPGADAQTSAYHYMDQVRGGDALKDCRPSFIVLVTDGQPTGPGDIDPATNLTWCDNPACGAADPAGAGCPCKAVLSAQKLYKDFNVRTYVVGFGEEAGMSVPRTINDFIAKAGGTGSSYLARNEKALQAELRNAVFDAVKGSYSTSPATASSGTQGVDKVSAGQVALDARVDFPTWKGNLVAYDLAAPTPTVLWNAATGFDATMDPDFWKKRRVYTSNGATMMRIQVDPATGAIQNKTDLFNLGLGANEDEAENIARWMLGDPTMGNPHVLGAMVNSTPIDVGQPGANPLPGGKAFATTYQNRPNLTYVGSDDGMLHAFFTKNTTVGATTYPAGREAFAYIPPDMFKVVTRLFAQGGQRAHPRQHIFGLSSSPKVRNMCVANCTSDATAVWKTLLTMGEGYGGHDSFMLDITQPFTGSGIKDPPAQLMWHSQFVSPADVATYDHVLGLTASVAGFYIGKTPSLDDQRIVFASGYAKPGAPAQQGLTIVNAKATTGQIVDFDVVPGSGSGCGQPRTVLTDVAVARNNGALEKQQIAAAYAGDTWGNLYRYVPTTVAGDTGTTGNITPVDDLGCNHPLHFSPTVVQMDRDDPANFSREVFLVQVTNSILDTETRALPTASQIVIRNDALDAGGAVVADTTFGDPATPGKKVIPANTICSAYSGATCTTFLPATARPLSTPMAILKGDATGFQIYSLWFVPGVGCTKGETFIAVHDITMPGAVVQKAGFKLASEPVTSTVVTNGKMVFVDSQTGVVDITAKLGVKFSEGGAISQITRNGGLRFRTTAWTEVP